MGTLRIEKILKFEYGIFSFFCVCECVPEVFVASVDFSFRGLLVNVPELNVGAGRIVSVMAFEPHAALQSNKTPNSYRRS